MSEEQDKTENIQKPINLDKQEIWNNFQDSRINRWAFRNIQEFAPHDVLHSSSKPTILPINSLNLDNIDFISGTDERISTDAALQYLYVDAVVVIANDSIVYERYLEGMLPETPHLLYSTSKPFAAVMISKLISLGYIDHEHDLITKYLPEYGNTAFADVTIRHLLDMQSGIDIRDIKDRNELERAFGFAPPVNDENMSSISLMMHSKKFPAGTMTDYNSLNTDMLSVLATKITGRSVSNLIQKNIFDPLGAEFDGLIIKDPNGINELGGGIAITARDLAKFGLMLLKYGNFNGNQIVPAGYVPEILKSAEPAKWRDGWLAELTPQAKAYRSQLYICDDNFDKGSFFACGNHGTALYINPKTHSTIALLCSYPTALDPERFNTMMALLRALSNSVDISRDKI